jgi:hypothetical protein
MKYITSFLLSLLLLLQLPAQTVTKYPIITGQQFGLVVIKSTKAPAKAPLLVFLHGIGERGKGTSADLDKIVNGLPANLKAGIEKYGFIGVAVQSDAAFTLNEPGFARSWAIKNLPVDTTRKYLTGLSWGGGGTAGFIKSSPANAQLFDAAAPIAMTWQTNTGYEYAAAAGIPVWIFHNINDPNGGTLVGASTGYYDQLMAKAPRIKPAITLFNGPKVHGGWGEAYSPDKIPVPAGSGGLIAPAVNLYEWFLLNSSTVRVAVPELAPPSTTQTAVISYTLTGSKITLDAQGSSAYKSCQWEVTARPLSVSPWASFITGARWPIASATFPAEGNYTIQLTTFSNADYTGTTKQASISVTIGTTAPEPPKVVATYDLVRKVISFTDGTMETIVSASMDVAKKIITIVTDKGSTYTF